MELPKAVFTASGPVNGLGHPDSNGAYVLITILRASNPTMRFAMSRLGAETFAIELRCAITDS